MGALLPDLLLVLRLFPERLCSLVPVDPCRAVVHYDPRNEVKASGVGFIFQGADHRPDR